MSEAGDEKDKGREGVYMPHKGKNMAIYILAVVAVVVALVVASMATGILSFGSDRESVTITGAGATFPQPLISKWADVYYNKTGGKVRINYGGGGSGQGISQILAKTVDFGGTDAPLDYANVTANGILHVPETIGAVVIAYNLPGINYLRLSGPVIAAIFMKNITKWNDPQISALNPGVTLPPNDIATIVRSDSSGTTFVFTGYLKVVDPVWAQLYGQKKSLSWPEGTIAQNGNAGVAQAVQGTSYTIGYIELTYALQNNIRHATLQNHDGYFVNASLETTAAAAAGVVLPAGDGDWSNVNILDKPGANAYPIATFTYILVYKELYNEASKMNKTAAKALVDFLWWAIHEEGQEYAERLSYAPLPQSVVELNENTLKSITYKGEKLI
ncbi:MAG: phosphate ABC transporter substrate-binding protein PstS [Thermoplasmata archaeon]